MSPGIVGLVLLAAVIHVSWNVLLKGAREPLRFATVSNTIGALVLAPAAAIAWWATGADRIPVRAFVLATVAGGLEVAYFSFLTAAYRRGDISVVYPIARGTAPLLSVVAGIGILGERLGVAGSLGVAGLLTGLMAVRRPWLLFRRAAREASPHLTEAALFAFATGVAIAAYSAVDRTGARATEPWIYAGMLSVTVSAGLWARLALAARFWPPAAVAASSGKPAPPGTGAPLRPARDSLLAAAAVGVFSFVGYGLVLFAYRHAPLTAVAPLRESAVVFASGWGTLRLGEAYGRKEAVWRIGGAGLIVLGIFLLAWDGR